MHKLIVAAGATVLMSACSEQAPVQKKEETPTALKTGQYVGTWKVESVQSADRTIPATKLKQDASGPAVGCVAADGTIEAAIFAEDGDKCTVANPYVRNGRIGMDLTCSRKGQGGEVRQSVSGTFTADSIDADVSTTTYLAGRGNYAMTRKIAAKRAGECTAATTEKTS